MPASFMMLAAAAEWFLPMFFGGLFLCWMGVVHWSLKDIKHSLRNRSTDEKG